MEPQQYTLRTARFLQFVIRTVVAVVGDGDGGAMLRY